MRFGVVCAFAAAVGSLLAGPSHALTNIRAERWFTANSAIFVDAVPPVDSVSQLTVTFDAVATALDASNGFRFALAERDGDGNDILVRFELPACDTYPAPGSPIMVRALVDLYCDAAGGLHARSLGWAKAQWCDAPVTGVCEPPTAFLVPTPESSEPEGFELVALDENDQEGSFPSPEDGLHSRASGPGQRFDVVGTEFPESGVIGIYADSTGTVCSATVEPLVPFRWYLVAHLAGFMRCGGFSFTARVEGMPASIIHGITANPGSFLIGSITGSGGVVGFNECELGADDVIMLATINGISNGPLDEVVLETVGVLPPISVNPWPEPFAFSCPSPETGFERRLRGSRFIINPAPGTECDVESHVEETSWQKLKALYR